VIGETVGSYRIVRVLGYGGMGRVYLAEHTLIGKHAAVKVLHPQLCANREVVNRFFNEARSSSLIKHPGVVDIYDFGRLPDGRAYIVMEFLEGESLQARLHREGFLRLELLVDIARQVAAALAAAHQRGIVHRDLKPDNIFLITDSETRSGIRIKILDFGIAKLTDDTNPGLSTTTRTDAIIGTPTYMSPEQCRGAGHVDHRTDIYSLGCVVFEMVTGRPPFTGQGPGEVIAAHLLDDAPSLEGVLPTQLSEAVARMLAKNVSDRFPSMADVAATLAEVTVPVPPPTSSSAPTTRMAAVKPWPPPEGEIGVRRRPTTLDAASGEVQDAIAPPKAGSRSRLLPVGVFAVLLLGATGLVVAKRTRSHAAAEPTMAALTSETPLALPAPVAPPVERAPAKRVTIALSSQPSGADVYRAADGARLGRTPWRERYAASSGEAVFVLRLKGHRQAIVAIGLERDAAREVALDKLPRPPARPRADKKPTENGVVNPYDD
jgi:serine/threonine-protein kinase